VNIYVETNFVLELVFAQEQHASCEQILALCESGQSRLIMPAYCLAEPHEKLTRQAGSRRELQRNLEMELRQLARTASYTVRINSIQDIASLLVRSNEEEKQRFIYYNRNSKDFDNPDIIDELDRNNCRMIPRFDHGYGFIQARLHP
jgi:hypothetical protein